MTQMPDLVQGGYLRRGEMSTCAWNEEVKYTSATLGGGYEGGEDCGLCEGCDEGF